MVLNFDELREQLDEILWHTWDPMRLSMSDKNRHAYFSVTQELAEFCVDKPDLVLIKHFLAALEKRCWPTSDVAGRRERAAVEIAELMQVAEIELH